MQINSINFSHVREVQQNGLEITIYYFSIETPQAVFSVLTGNGYKSAEECGWAAVELMQMLTKMDISLEP